MKVRVFVIACLLVFSVSVVADEVALSNAKALFSAERIKNRKRAYPLLAARLSPSGTHLIYPKMVPASPPDYKTAFNIMVFDIATGKEKTIEASLPGGYASVYTRYNFFSPSGDKLAIAKFLKGGNGRDTEIVIYDLKKSKLDAKGFRGAGRNIVMFDNTEDTLISSQAEGTGWTKSKMLSGYFIKRIPVSGWIHTPSPYSPYAAVFAHMRTPERKYGFQMWDLKAEKKIADLPMHEKNGRLDDVQGQWTADGRYLFYFDIAKKDGEEKLSGVIRVWDVQENKQTAELFDAMVVGPGPSKTTMVMAAYDKKGQTGMFVYDVKNKKYMDIGPKGAKAIHACGNKLLYMLKENGEDMVYTADISMTKDDK